MSPTIERYEDNAGEWRWRLVADNGNIMADSGQGYASKSGVDEAIESIQSHGTAATALAVNSATFEIYEDDADEWRWRLRHRNGRIMADSGQGYGSRSDAVEAVNRVKANAGAAPTEEA